MKFLLLLLFGTICVLEYSNAASLNRFSKTTSNNFNSRVIGGSNATRHQFPYMVDLHLDGGHLCGASLVSPTWVITAGHCCDPNLGFDCSKVNVIAGQINQLENHPDIQKSSVAEVVIHPGYYYDIFGLEIDHDIALLQLTSSLTFTKAVQPVTLPSANQVFTEGWLSGWGIYERPWTSPLTLQWLKMKIITNDECREVLKNFDPTIQLALFDTMVCAMSLTGGSETACNGDSGGPIADKNGVLIGITSWGVICYLDRDNAPSVFTDVSEHLDFIQEHVNDLPTHN